MLVCNVSLRPPRAGITADVAETTTAADATASGNIVFATLVDDPASVGAIVDAYLGEIMLEAASAVDAITAGSVYVAAVDEAVTAVSAQDGAVPAIFTDSVTESVAADSDQDATVTAAAMRSAMLPTAFVNSSVSREANVDGTMANL